MDANCGCGSRVVVLEDFLSQESASILLFTYISFRSENTKSSGARSCTANEKDAVTHRKEPSTALLWICLDGAVT